MLKSICLTSKTAVPQGPTNIYYFIPILISTSIWVSRFRNLHFHKDLVCQNCGNCFSGSGQFQCCSLPENVWTAVIQRKSELISYDVFHFQWISAKKRQISGTTPFSVDYLSDFHPGFTFCDIILSFKRCSCWLLMGRWESFSMDRLFQTCYLYSVTSFSVPIIVQKYVNRTVNVCVDSKANETRDIFVNVSSKK